MWRLMIVMGVSVHFICSSCCPLFGYCLCVAPPAMWWGCVSQALPMGKRSASKEEIPEYSLFGDAFYDKQRCRVSSQGMLLLSVALLVLLKPTIKIRDENVWV